MRKGGEGVGWGRPALIKEVQSDGHEIVLSYAHVHVHTHTHTHTLTKRVASVLPNPSTFNTPRHLEVSSGTASWATWYRAFHT
jgi:hypothetical protein